MHRQSGKHEEKPLKTPRGCPLHASGQPCQEEGCMWYSTQERKCAMLLCAEYLSTFCDFVWDELMRS